jgi:predicted metal-dependent phosphoesterase TrpH
MHSQTPFRVIFAEEILTPYGEVIGMFLKQTIPSCISTLETISRIREQDGLVCVPHPFDIFPRFGLGGKILERIVNDIDIVEVFNARTSIPWCSSKSLSFAEKYSKAKSAGSDSHTLGEIGKTYIEIPEFDGKEDFIRALQCGKIHRGIANPFVHFSSLKVMIKSLDFK